MIDFGVFLIVFLILYFLECVVWVPAGSVAFRLPANARHNLRILTKSRRSARSTLVFSLPFCFGSGVIVCPAAPISICPEGILNSQGNLTCNHFLAFEDIQTIETEDRKLLLNGSTFATLTSGLQARDLARFLQQLQRLTVGERGKEINQVIKSGFDSDRANLRLRKYAKQIQPLKWNSIALFGFIFFVSPVVVWKWGLHITWPALLSFLLLNVLLIAWTCRCVDRELFPGGDGHRFHTIAMFLLSPAAALHATKYLARDLGRDYNPLALAGAKCSDAEFSQLAASVLRDTTFTIDNGQSVDIKEAGCDLWFRQRFQRAIASLLHKRGFSLDELLAPPRRESQYVRSYCPRCLSQFVIREGVCTDCGGIPLHVFSLDM